MRQFCVLIADDEPTVCDTYKKALLREPWTVEVAHDGRKALDFLCMHHPDVAVLDYSIPYLNGLEVLEATRRRGIQTYIIILTGYGNTEMSFQAAKIGAQKFLNKPIMPLDLIANIREALDIQVPSHLLAERIDSYLRDHLCNSSLKLKDLCEQFHFSSAYVERLTRDHLGASFRKRLSYHRIQKAKQILESSDDPIYLVAEQCGYKHWSRLTEVFTRLERIPPRKYREICRSRRTK